MIFPEDLDNWFTYHETKPHQLVHYQKIRQAARTMAFAILESTPSSVEQSAAMLRLRESVMLANAAVACQPRESQRGAA